MTAAERKAEIKRVNAILRTTTSPQLHRDMAKYLKRLEKEERFGTTKNYEFGASTIPR